MSNQRRTKKLSRDDFIILFIISTILTLLITFITCFGIFVDATAFGALIPFGFVALCFGFYHLGGWIYDRWYSSSTN